MMSVEERSESGVSVEVRDDGNSGLAFETPLHALAFAETVHQTAQKGSLLQKVVVVDDQSERFGQTGYICAIERETKTMHLEVCFAPDNQKHCYRIEQLQTVPK